MSTPPQYQTAEKTIDVNDTRVILSIDKWLDVWGFSVLVLWPRKDPRDYAEKRNSDWIAYRLSFDEAYAAIGTSTLPKGIVPQVRREMTKLEKASREGAAWTHRYINKLPEPAPVVPHPVDLTTAVCPEIPDFDTLLKESIDRQHNATYRPGSWGHVLASESDYKGWYFIASSDGLTCRLEDAMRSGWLPIAEGGREPRRAEKMYSVALIDGVEPQKVKCMFCGHKLRLSSHAARREHMRDVHGVANPWREIWPKPKASATESTEG